MIQRLTFHPVPAIRIVIVLLPEHRHTFTPVMQQVIKGFTEALPAEPLQVQAQPIREELVGRQVFKGPHLFEDQKHRQRQTPPPQVASGLTCVKFQLWSRSAEASLSCLKVEVKSERASSISCRHERRSDPTRRDQNAGLTFSRRATRKPSSSSSPRRPSLVLKSWWILKTKNQTAGSQMSFSTFSARTFTFTSSGKGRRSRSKRSEP